TRWRDAPLDRPENGLLGVMFGEWLWAAAPLVVSDPGAWLWTGTGAAAGDAVPGLFSVEIDRRYSNGAEPAGVIELGAAPVESHEGTLSHGHATLYRTASG